MSSEDSPISAPAGAAIVPVEQLQFRHAEPVGGQAASRRCAGCKSPIYATYFQTAGKDICGACAGRIQRMQQAPPAHALLQAAL